jgi:carboxymethylenebutenolidase
MYQGMICEPVTFQGHSGATMDAYYARPGGDGPFPGVVLLHHAPGWDEWSIEATRRLAHHGFAAISPHLYTRDGPGSPDDVAAVARAAGGQPDDQTVGDAEGAARFLRARPESNGKVGIIGFCSGGRQVVLVASRSRAFDAAVDCWGGRVVASGEHLNERQPVAPIDLTANLACPLLGIFGNDDQAPSPAEVDQHEAALKQHGKPYEFHRYDGAGHGFFAWERPNYRQAQATDAWPRVYAWFDKHLR